MYIAADEFTLKKQYFSTDDSINVKKCCLETITQFISYHGVMSAQYGQFLLCDDYKLDNTAYFSVRQRGWLSAYVFTYILFSLGEAG
jgi:hypothetical protein